MADILKFATDKANVFLMLLDASGSMANDSPKVREGLKRFKEELEDFSEVDSIAVSICQFESSYRPGDFKSVKDLNIQYSADGGTALYHAIVKAAEKLQDYNARVAAEARIDPTATFILFSDGKPEGDQRGYRYRDAKEAIEKLNYAGINTVFVAFGEAISSDFGKDMGFTSVIDVNKRETLTEFLGVELSKSCKEQSMRAEPLGANFFSKAVNDKSEGYSQTTAQVLEDNSWIDDI